MREIPKAHPVGRSPSHFPSAAAFRSWLRKNHASATEIVLRLARKHAAGTGVTYAEALDEALCFGWIDGVRRGFDKDSFTTRFTPRRPKSIWSRINVGHVRRLIKSRRMTKAGLAAFNARDEIRTGVYSFERPSKNLTRGYKAKFRANQRAWEYFEREAPWYRRTSIFFVVNAKREETRLKRLALLIDCSARRERIPPLRRVGR